MPRTSLFLLIIISLYSAMASADRQVAVATASPLATKVGINILKQGGNAFDAAAAITASLAVVEPYGSGLGGGGFWLLYDAANNKQVMLDGREKAPLASHEKMYLDGSDNVIKGLSINGPMAAAIPGIPAGIEHLVKRYGRLSLKTVLTPAINQAKEGFPVTDRYHKLLNFRYKAMQAYPATVAIFLKENQVPELGDFIVQTDLAKTLNAIATNGADAFYKGQIAAMLVDSVKKHGGIWQLRDLENYNLRERAPITITYNGIKITSATLPSSGGLVIGQTLNILQNFDLDRYDPITQKHIIIEAMRRAYLDRAAYLGDADFIDVPIDRLLDQTYAEGLATTIDTDRATPSDELSDLAGNSQRGQNTTHFSVIDADGNRVSATLSINLPFGSGFVADGTGVLLNNEMDDFSIKPITANSYGLIGHQANAIAPGKRPLSSMSPTFIETDQYIGILGTPGGSRIISMVLLAILDFAKGHLPDSWVRVPRYHHQYLPDQVQYELGALTALEKTELQAKGHVLKEINRHYGNMQAIMLWKRRNILFAASDRRGEGQAAVILLD